MTMLDFYNKQFQSPYSTYWKWTIEQVLDPWDQVEGKISSQQIVLRRVPKSTLLRRRRQVTLHWNYSRQTFRRDWYQQDDRDDMKSSEKSSWTSWRLLSSKFSVQCSFQHIRSLRLATWMSEATEVLIMGWIRVEQLWIWAPAFSQEVIWWGSIRWHLFSGGRTVGRSIKSIHTHNNDWWSRILGETWWMCVIWW